MCVPWLTGLNLLGPTPAIVSVVFIVSFTAAVKEQGWELGLSRVTGTLSSLVSSAKMLEK